MATARKKIDKAWTLAQAAEVYNRCMQAVPVKKKNGEPEGEYTFNPKGALDALQFIDSVLGETPTAAGAPGQSVVIVDDIGGDANG